LEKNATPAYFFDTRRLWQRVDMQCLTVDGTHRRFLRATAECFARLSYGLGVCPSVRPFVRRLSVCHTDVLYQNGAN